MAASVRRGGPSARDRLGGVERQEGAERAVEAPAVRRRVEMRPAPDLGQIGLAARAAGRRRCRPRRTRPRARPRASSPPRARTPAARPRPARAGWCRPRGRSRRACRDGRECARRATPAWRFGTPPESTRAGCSRARVCQGEGDSHANGDGRAPGARARQAGQAAPPSERAVEEGDDAALVLLRVCLGAVHVLGVRHLPDLLRAAGELVEAGVGGLLLRAGPSRRR